MRRFIEFGRPAGVVAAVAATILLVAWTGAAPADPGIPDLGNSHAEMATDSEVSLFSVPDGSGDAPTACYLLGGDRVDATITLTLLDWNDLPIYRFPAEDMWLEAADGGLILCPGGSCADGDTDAQGRATWTMPLRAGCSGIGTTVLANGIVLEPVLPMRHNSADVSCDLQVNLTDIALYVQDWSAYDYRSDFFWDDQINLSDLILLARASGARCP